MHSSHRNRKKSPLLRLPAELRNHIYEYVFGGLVVCALAEPAAKRKYKVYYKDKRARPPYKWIHITKMTSRFLVCRQFYSETVAYMFEANDLMIGDLMSYQLFMESLAAEKRNVIRRVVITTLQLRMFKKAAMKLYRSEQDQFPSSRWIAQLKGLETLTVKVLGWEIQGEQGETVLQHIKKDAAQICGHNVKVVVEEVSVPSR